MGAAESRQSHYREQNAATSAVARAAAPGARGHSPGVHPHIDAGRAFLTLSLGRCHECAAAILRTCRKAANGSEMKGREDRLAVPTGELRKPSGTTRRSPLQRFCFKECIDRFTDG